MDSNKSLSRRRFLTAAAGLAAVPLAQLLAGTARAADVPHLSPDDPAAKALAYTDNAAALTPQKDALYKPGSHCGSCALYQAAQASNGFAPCAAFPGKAVNSKGWCHAWTAMS